MEANKVMEDKNIIEGVKNMNIISKARNKIANKFVDVKEWFKERGDDFFEIDKRVDEIDSEGLLPDEASHILNDLEEKKQNAENRYDDKKELYMRSSENRQYYFDKLEEKREEFKQFKENHHGILARVAYNLPPLRFLSVGREYQKMRKEIKMLKREHAYWSRYSDESKHAFDGATEQRKEKSRAVAEYKRIIVGKADVYKEEFKLLKEYSKLTDYRGDNIMTDKCSAETQEKIESYLNEFMDNWFGMNRIECDFDVKSVTKIVTKMRKGKELNEADKKVLENVGKDTQQQGQEEQQTQQPKNIFERNGIDRRVVEKMLERLKPGIQMDPVEFMAFVAKWVEVGEKNINDAYAYIRNEKDVDVIKSLSEKGADQLKKYMQMSDEERTNNKNIVLDAVLFRYNDAKDELDREQQAQRENGQQQQQQGD